MDGSLSAVSANTHACGLRLNDLSARQGKLPHPKDEGKRKKKVVQKNLFEELGEAEAAESGWGELKGPTAGKTVLDQVHQSMILFAAGRGELMRSGVV